MWIVILLYSLFLLFALTNLLLMRRPPKGEGSSETSFEVLVPARNEAHNLPKLIAPLITAGVKVTLFDDESDDGTVEVAEHLGARVIRPQGTLAEGWVGKNRACYELAKIATANWAVFLDADTIPTPDFAARLSGFLSNLPQETVMISGFPRLLPGRGIEPLYLGWVPWILLSANSFGLTARTGLGHPRFTNGQFGAWRRQVLQDLKPHEHLKGEILEDVKIGRLLAQKRQRIEIINASAILSVQMYTNIREAFDGMSKNSGDIVKHPMGSLLIAVFFAFAGWAWAFTGHLALPLYFTLIGTKWISDRIIHYPMWTTPFIPITCTLASATIVRALYWKRMGKVSWKGRAYPY